MYKFVFVGHPNAGKSTWINYLANADMKVANYLGVSVKEENKAITFHDESIMLIDLPGIYDLDNVNAEESYTRDYLLNESVDLIINVIDIRDIKRSLHLTSQLKKLHIPMMVLLNFVEEDMSKQEMKKLSKLIKTPILFSTFKQKEEILSTMLDVKNEYIENDFDERTLREVEMDTFSKNYKWDKFLLHPHFGILFLSLILGVSIYCIYLFSLPFSNLITIILEGIQEDFINTIKTVSLIDNIIKAIWFSFTSIVSYLPFLSGIFLFIAILEESGYIARIAYLLDTPMHLFHLSGKSVIPLLVGFGCNVPAIMATRTISSRKERIACAMMIPFISCSAKLPIFLLFASTFFKGMHMVVIVLLYLLSVLVSLFIGSYIASKSIEEEFFLLELPSYQIPKMSLVLSKTKKEIIHFLKKVSKVMVISMLILTFVFPLFQSKVYHTFASPLPFSTSETAIESLPFGLISKENLVVYYAAKKQDVPMQSFISNLWQGNDVKLRAFCYLMYLAMSIPCVMTLAAIRTEFGRKVLWASIIVMLVVPFVLGSIAFHVILFLQRFLF